MDFTDALREERERLVKERDEWHEMRLDAEGEVMARHRKIRDLRSLESTYAENAVAHSVGKLEEVDRLYRATYHLDKQAKPAPPETEPELPAERPEKHGDNPMVREVQDAASDNGLAEQEMAHLDRADHECGEHAVATWKTANLRWAWVCEICDEFLGDAPAPPKDKPDDAPSVRSAAKAALDARPGRNWKAAEVATALQAQFADRDPKKLRNSVKTALRALAAQGKVRKLASPGSKGGRGWRGGVIYRSTVQIGPKDSENHGIR